MLEQDVPNIFSAGLDLVAVSQLSSFEEVDKFLAGLEGFWMRIYTSKLATIAAINVSLTFTLLLQIYYSIEKVLQIYV